MSESNKIGKSNDERSEVISEKNRHAKKSMNC